MTKVLIAVDTSGLASLHCDNPRCGAVLPMGQEKWGKHLIGLPCPRCDSNLLTRKDYEATEKHLKIIAWINKWFGWLGKEPAELENDPKSVTFGVRHHAGKTTITRG